MRPETTAFIDTARTMLERGRLMLGVPLYDDAGRAAYLACFHAAQALIFERERRVLKTHHGVQSEFHRLAREMPGIDPRLPPFLSSAFTLKIVADYDLSSHIHAPPEEIRAALETATRFVEVITTLLSTLPTGKGAGSA
jgi:uncharacterized protein (UPF0332 family)